MTHLFGRLPKPPTEEEKLEILNKNVLPYYINNLGLALYGTVDELENLLKRLEKNYAIAEKAEKRRSNGPQTRVTLEPDLAAPSTSSASPRIESGSGSHVGSNARVHFVESDGRRCWNCQGVGHAFRTCPQPRRRQFCFRCGRVGTVKAECPRCSRNGRSNGSTGSRQETDQVR